MNKNGMLMTLSLTLLWIILQESFYIFTILMGVVLSVVCVFICTKLLPLKKIANIKAGKLVAYIFYLIGQIYLAGFNVIKIIFTGAEVDIVDIKTNISNDTLRVILADSITLTPGTILVDMKGECMKVLWLRNRNDPYPEEPSDLDCAIKGNLESHLTKAQG